MLQFMRNLVGVKADKAVQAGVEALVRWDPQSASEAELRTMEQHLDELGQQVARARQSYDKETREAECDPVVVGAAHGRRRAAAEAARGRNRARDEGGLERSLATLVTMLEQMASGDGSRKEGRDRRQGIPRDAREDLCRGRRQASLRALASSSARAARHGARRSAAADGRAAGRRGTPRRRA